MTIFDWLFAVANPIALLGWLGLLLFPRRMAVVNAITLVIPGLLAILYAGLVASFFAGGEGGFGSIADVRAMFASDALLLAGWLHYLAFDLFVGAWQVRTAGAEGIPHVLVIPCLALTFLFGPAGFLLFLILRLSRSPGRLLEV